MSGIISRLSIYTILAACLFIPHTVQASSISPEAIDLSVRPGESGEFTLTLRNSADRVVAYHVDIVRLSLDQSEKNIAVEPLNSYENWFQLSSSDVVLNPNETKEIGVTISVPSTAASETIEFGVRILEDGSETTGVEITSGLLSLVFLTIEGDIQAAYDITSFEVDTSVTTSWPIQSTLVLANEGERVIQPQGTIGLIDLFGKTVWSSEINVEQFRILSGESRAYTTAIAQNVGFLLPGPYRLRLQAAAWTHGEEFTQELTIIYLPWGGTVLVGAFLAAFFLILKKANVSRKGI